MDIEQWIADYKKRRLKKRSLIGYDKNGLWMGKTPEQVAAILEAGDMLLVLAQWQPDRQH
jgi:hypothetical protein